VRRFFVPEVVQTSAMDCGPASLKALLEGLGLSVSYGRLREACQTDVDGTSIDTLEDLAVQLGLDAEQVMLPPDHLLLAASKALPAIAVVRMPDGNTHFVVVWRTLGPLVQIMDPATGRRWVRAERFVSDLYVHEQLVPRAAFEEWAKSDELVAPIVRRLALIGCASEGERLLAEATDGAGRAALDAALRWTASVVRSGAIGKGREAAGVLAIAVREARAHGEEAIPARYWTALPAAPADDGEPQVRLRGAVLVRVRGPAAAAAGPRPLSPELVRALEEPEPRPWSTLVSLLGGDGLGGRVLRATLGVAVLGAAAGAVVEALLFRGLLHLGQALGVVQQRLGAAAALVGFLALLALVETSSAWGVARLGRRLETRVRVAFLSKIPRLGDRYLSSRPVSDMVHRVHAGYRVRAVPELAAQMIRVALEIVATTVGLAWLDPAGAPYAVAAAMCAMAVPMVFVSALGERDMKARTHEGALSTLYLDALLGLAPIRTHGAERAVARQHEGLLVDWVRAARSVVRVYLGAELAQSAVGTLLAVGLLYRYVAGAGDPSGVLLLAYWALALPSLGQELGVLLRQLPGQRNAALRLLEPLGALEDGDEARTAPAEEPAARGVELRFEEASVVAAGHTVLQGLDLAVGAGEHVAIVGASGAGKTSLLGLLLGWHRPSAGRLLVDGAALDGGTRQALRDATAWVDPAVHLWNRSLVDNLLYGARADAPAHMAAAIAAADLAAVLEKLPEGLQTALGEGGGLVSGGEGQRVRLARGLLRPDARLVLLDEPFRGLDRERRSALLDRARAWWKDATLLCVTHDVGETLRFDRVLVVEGGRLVEDGVPAELLAGDTRYRAMIEAERTVAREVWGGAGWRRLHVDAGRVVEAQPNEEGP
jgi:ATP-binding cassette subfamily B protein